MKSQIRLVLAAAALLAACSRSEKKAGPLVAEGDGFAVTSAEFKQKLDEQSPAIRARYATIDRKKEFLESLVRFELLAQEARKKGLDKDPEVQETFDKILVQKLVRQAFDEKATPPGDGDVKAYYEEHVAEFVKPERVRVALVFLQSPAGTPTRPVRSADAKKLLARVKVEEPKNPLAFSSIAREASEDAATKAAGGDAGYRTKEELAQQYSPELAAAAFALKDTGQVSGVVETPQGFGILKLLARQAGVNRTLDEVRPQLAARLGREARTRSFEEYVKKLRGSASVKINDAELERISVVDTTAGGTAK